MTIEDQWKALEGEGNTATWRLQLARPVKGHPLFAAVEPGTGRRALLLRIPESVIPPRRQWPNCCGLDLLATRLDAQTYLGVLLKEPRFADVFSALAEDLARRIENLASAADAVRAFLGQLARWQRFLTATVEGLSEQAQRGLWGELRFLHGHLGPGLGIAHAVEGWKGGERSHQDFQFENGAVEIKTTMAKQPQSIHITSERQLDDTHWPALFLHVFILEVHEDDTATLPALVERIRSALIGHPSQGEHFEEVLLAAGYLDVHVPRYTARSYAIRRELTFEVKDDFPRIVEGDLPTGTGDINYALDLAACEPYVATVDEIVAVLASPSV